MNPYNIKFPGIFAEKRVRKLLLYTKNLTPGQTFFDEKIVKDKGSQFREFNPMRSKLASAVMKNISQLGLMQGDVVLYLGASHGYTTSFVSDIVGENGFIFAVDFAPRVMRDLVFVCEKRKNIAPILADANQPMEYADNICAVDFLYQDIAQRNQAEIFLKNCELFLKKDGFAFLVVKSRSVDITKKPKQVFKEIRALLEKNITIVDYRELEPFQKDHCVFVCKKR